MEQLFVDHEFRLHQGVHNLTNPQMGSNSLKMELVWECSFE